MSPPEGQKVASLKDEDKKALQVAGGLAALGLGAAAYKKYKAPIKGIDNLASKTGLSLNKKGPSVKPLPTKHKNGDKMDKMLDTYNILKKNIGEEGAIKQIKKDFGIDMTKTSSTRFTKVVLKNLKEGKSIKATARKFNISRDAVAAVARKKVVSKVTAKNIKEKKEFLSGKGKKFRDMSANNPIGRNIELTQAPVKIKATKLKAQISGKADKGVISESLKAVPNSKLIAPSPTNKIKKTKKNISNKKTSTSPTVPNSTPAQTIEGAVDSSKMDINKYKKDTNKYKKDTNKSRGVRLSMDDKVKKWMAAAAGAGAVGTGAYALKKRRKRNE